MARSGGKGGAPSAHVARSLPYKTASGTKANFPSAVQKSPSHGRVLSVGGAKNGKGGK